jgi:hypothetical protein
MVGALAMPAAAHVEVTGSPARAGAQNAVLTFTAEAESQSAGIVSMRVVLPAGITAGDVSWVDGPAGWHLTTAADGYTVGGPPVPVGQNASFRVRIRQLPATRSLVFKTIETYSDGKVSRWIGEPTTDNPAPVLSLAPGTAPTPPTVSPSSASPTAAEMGSPTAAAPRGTQDGSKPPGASWVLVGLVVAAAVAGVVATRRRKQRLEE